MVFQGASPFYPEGKSILVGSMLNVQSEKFEVQDVPLGQHGSNGVMQISRGG